MATTLGALAGSTAVLTWDDLDVAESLDGSEQMVADQGGSSVKVTPALLATRVHGYSSYRAITGDYEVVEQDLGGLIELNSDGSATVITLPSNLGNAGDWVDIYQGTATTDGIDIGASIDAEALVNDESNPILVQGDLYRFISLIPSMGIWYYFRLSQKRFTQKVINDGDLVEGVYVLKQDDDRKTLYIDCSGAVEINVGNYSYDAAHSTTFISYQAGAVNFTASAPFSVAVPTSRVAQLFETGSAATLIRNADGGTFDLIGDLALGGD